MSNRILIVKHEYIARNEKSLLEQLTKIWEQQGFDIEVIQGVGKQIETDIVISHINLTVIPDEYTDFFENFSIVINRRAKNISKSLISKNLLSFDDNYDGPVIVKTDENYGGYPERRIKKRTGLIKKSSFFERTLRCILFKEKIISWECIEYLNPYEYPRFNSIKDVPSGVWKNNKLIVEKFLPEKNSEGNYCLRYWIFLGDKEISVHHTSTNPIVKHTDQNSRIITDVPEELRNMRQRLGIDYGRFDYSIVDGKAIVYDINTTPSAGEDQLKLIGSRLRGLADGINCFLEET